MDEGRIALTPAEKLSYLKKEEQLTLAGLIRDFEATPSLSQATRFKDLSAKGKLDSDTMFDLLTQPKPNQKETLKLDLYKLRDLFPNCFPNDMEKSILQILNDWYKYEQEKEKSQNGWGREER